MEADIKNKYNQAILEEAIRRYKISSSHIRLLDGFESFIYEYSYQGRNFILRIGHSSRRSVSLIQGEVDWINYLAAGGASVSQAINSRNDRLVEDIDDGQGGFFLATAFQKAPGGPPGRDQWNPSLFENYGRLVGRLHRLSKRYTPSRHAWKRPQWDDIIMLDPESWLPPSEKLVLRRYRGLKNYLDLLPRDEENYGLIHQDAHGGNIFVDSDSQITLFDFDDCAYSWYMNDIAIVLFYALVSRPDPGTYAGIFLRPFFQGYQEENTSDRDWLDELPHFLKLREIDLYAVIHRSFDVRNLDDPWVANYMQGRKEKIEADVPFVDFDFSSL